jgi:hypothetical protein
MRGRLENVKKVDGETFRLPACRSGWPKFKYHAEQSLACPFGFAAIGSIAPQSPRLMP